MLLLGEHNRGEGCADGAGVAARNSGNAGALVDQYQVIVFEELAPQEMGKSRGCEKASWT